MVHSLIPGLRWRLENWVFKTGLGYRRPYLKTNNKKYNSMIQKTVWRISTEECLWVNHNAGQVLMTLWPGCKGHNHLRVELLHEKQRSQVELHRATTNECLLGPQQLCNVHRATFGLTVVMGSLRLAGPVSLCSSNSFWKKLELEHSRKNLH